MVINSRVPPADMTIDSLAHIAVAMERAAAATYCRLAEGMERLHNPTAVKVFEHLVDVEREHEREITAWAVNLGISLPAISDDDVGNKAKTTEPNAARNLTLTPWQALNMAVASEKSAFEFFSMIAASARVDDVRRQAEHFASKKLEHIALLRLERKGAYRTDERARLEAIVGTEIPVTLGAFETSAERLMNGLADRYFELADEAKTSGDDVSVSLLQQLAVSIASSAKSPMLSGGKTNTDITETLRAALRETEAAFDAFIAVAERATDEDVVGAAQRRAGDCVALLERLRDRLTAHFESLS